MPDLSWRARDVAVAALLVAVVAAQLGIPLHRLAAVAAGEPAPVRFGWQMYCRAHEQLAVAVVLDDGQERDVDLSSLVVRSRSEVGFEALLPALCAASPRIRAVAVTHGTGDRVSFPCPERASRERAGGSGASAPSGRTPA